MKLIDSFCSVYPGDHLRESPEPDELERVRQRDGVQTGPPAYDGSASGRRARGGGKGSTSVRVRVGEAGVAFGRLIVVGATGRGGRTPDAVPARVARGRGGGRGGGRWKGLIVDLSRSREAVASLAADVAVVVVVVAGAVGVRGPLVPGRTIDLFN